MPYFTGKGEVLMEVEPIRDTNKIAAMREVLRAGGKNGMRNEVMFTMGINSSLRISDLLGLTFGDIMDKDGAVAADIVLKERKTGKLKKFPLNKAIRDALMEYIDSLGCIDPSLPLFPSRQGNSSIGRWRARQILSSAGAMIGLKRIGTHSLRKTFGYHVYQRTGGNLGLVQKLLNHSSSADTLRYIGIDKEQMDNTYLELNL
jgi:integrase